jgi:hypothetical protein
MGEPKTSSAPQSPNSSSKCSGGRQRIISSCLTCRRRKVKCDHVHPVCGACTRGSHVCTWTEQVQGQTFAGRISKPTLGGHAKIAKNSDVQSRLDRLEMLLEKAVAGQEAAPQTQLRPSTNLDRREHEAHLMPSPNSHTSTGQGMAADDGDGVLLLDEGRSQFVSSLHFALLADEVGSQSNHTVDRHQEPWLPSAHSIKIISNGCGGLTSRLTFESDTRHQGSAR